MPLLLPVAAPAEQEINLISADNTLVPAFGDGEQELLRKGTRYEIQFDMGEMDYVEALDWTDLTTKGDTVVMAVYQPGLVVGAPGAPRVNGPGQSGRGLTIDGLSDGYVVRKGQFLSVVTQGRRFLYRARATVTAAGGTAVVPLQTLLRFPPGDNDVVELEQPMIEGWARDVSGLRIIANHNVQVSFTVRER
ncbi:MAG: hypothetical protein LCH57_01955 [Proteobacteria bacterium]|nr:hypothetical protein [Pseudomonadota bacterium]